MWSDGCPTSSDEDSENAIIKYIDDAGNPAAFRRKPKMYVTQGSAFGSPGIYMYKSHVTVATMEFEMFIYIDFATETTSKQFHILCCIFKPSKKGHSLPAKITVEQFSQLHCEILTLIASWKFGVHGEQLIGRSIYVSIVTLYTNC